MRCFLPLALLLLVGCPLLVGCQPPRPAQTGRLGLPSDGSVRVLANTPVQQPDRVAGHWSVIGERNWAQPGVTEAGFTLADASPLNATNKPRSCNIWEIDLVTERRPDGIHCRTVLHGSNGETRKAAWILPASESLPVEITQATDTETRLPTTLTLATVNGKPLTLTIAR